MDDEDDAWSYSFPPSAESLPLKTPSQATLEPQLMADAPGGTPTSSVASEDLLTPPNEHTVAPDTQLLPFEQAAAPPPLISSTPTPLTALNTSAAGLTSFLQGSLALQPAFMLKLTPANPQTTKKEASLILSKDGRSTNALATNGDVDRASDSGLSPPGTPSSRGEFRNSIRIWQQKTAESALTDQREDGSTDSSFLQRTFPNIATSPMFGGKAPDVLEVESEEFHEASPKIIAYRKSTHKRTESDAYEIVLDEERFDPKLYVDEKFKNTPYRYATMKRNVEFHRIFRSLDLTDRLLDDFACALSREILLQGRVYITEHSLCFNSNLLGWVTSLEVPFNTITRIDKKSTAGLFPNGISVETNEGRHSFASFLSRDVTYDFIRTIWLVSTGKDLAELDKNASSELPTNGVESLEKNLSNYIMSIDEDDQTDNWNGDDFEDSEEESDRSSVEEEEAAPLSKAVSETVATGMGSITLLKSESTYKNSGPDSHPPTSVTGTFEDAENETEVCNEVIDAPLGIVFDVMFGSDNTSFHLNFLKGHDASEISEYGPFQPLADDPSKLERTYSYRRALGYSIGPKSTKCLVSEVIEHLNVSDYIVVLSTTATPDVPSGGSFTVKTRYYFTWGENNNTQLRIAFYVKWTGRSWIKNVVEKLTLSAQITTCQDMVAELKKELAQHTHQVLAPVAVTAEAKEPKPLKQKEARKKKRAPKSVAPALPSTSLIAIGAGILFTLLIMSMLLNWKIATMVIETREILSRQLDLMTHLVALVARESDQSWWDKLKHRDSDHSGSRAQATLLLKLLQENDKLGRLVQETVEALL